MYRNIMTNDVRSLFFDIIGEILEKKDDRFTAKEVADEFNRISKSAMIKRGVDKDMAECLSRTPLTERMASFMIFMSNYVDHIISDTKCAAITGTSVYDIIGKTWRLGKNPDEIKKNIKDILDMAV